MTRKCPECGGWLVMVAGELGCYRCPWQPEEVIARQDVGSVVRSGDYQLHVSTGYRGRSRLSLNKLGLNRTTTSEAVGGVAERLVGLPTGCQPVAQLGVRVWVKSPSTRLTPATHGLPIGRAA